MSWNNQTATGAWQPRQGGFGLWNDQTATGTWAPRQGGFGLWPKFDPRSVITLWDAGLTTWDNETTTWDGQAAGDKWQKQAGSE